MKESSFQRKIIKKATSKGAYVINIWGNGFMKSGLPDLVICYLGYFIGVELKTDKGIVSELQKAVLGQIKDSGGFTLILRPKNENELWELMEEIHDRTTKQIC